MTQYNEELVSLIQKNINVKENLSKLYEKNKGFIYNCIKCYSSRIDIDDLMQEAFWGLKRAVDLYKTDRNIKFLTYANYWIKICAKRYFERMTSIVHISSTQQQQINKYLKNSYYSSKRNSTSQINFKIFYETNQYYSLTSDNELHSTVCKELEIVELKLLNDKLWETLKKVLDSNSYDLIIKLYKENYTMSQYATYNKVSTSWISYKNKVILKKLKYNSMIIELAQNYGII